MSEFIELTKHCLKTNPKAKQSTRGFIIIFGFLIAVATIGFSSLNIYLFFLMLPKFLILTNMYYYLVVNNCSGTRNYLELWKDSDIRILLARERMKIAYLWTVKFGIGLILLFILIRYGLETSEKWNHVVSQFTPDAIDLTFIVISIILSFLAIYTVHYWINARFNKIIRYSERTNILVPDLKNIMAGWTLGAIIYVITYLFCDLFYSFNKLGKNLQSLQFLGPLLKSFGNYLLPLEILVLLLTVIGTYIDGKRQIRSRTDFVIPPPLG